MLPGIGNMLTCCGNMLPVSRQHDIVYLCSLYPATDGLQTGNNFVADNMLLVAGNMLLEATCCKRGLRALNHTSKTAQIILARTLDRTHWQL